MTTAIRHASVRPASAWVVSALALLALALAACAGNDSADSEDTGVAYSQCMRDNGVPDFPDPNPDGSFALGHDKFDEDDPTFRSAQEACSDLAPGREHQDTGDPAYIAQMRQFSQCMRENGVPDFPDPDADGRLRGQGHEQRDDPTYRAAMETCRQKLPGGGDHR